MDREELRATLVELFNEDTGQSLSSLADNVHLVADLGLDSVDTVSLVMQVERHYRIRMTHEELSDALTVGSMLDLITSKLVAPAASEIAQPALKAAA
ncbi:MAG: acpP 5 [Planctomycetaceae bacterium]|nr:acpP 5 [Planctomycetaceae bacterium]